MSHYNSYYWQLDKEEYQVKMRDKYIPGFWQPFTEIGTRNMGQKQGQWRKLLLHLRSF